MLIFLYFLRSEILVQKVWSIYFSSIYNFRCYEINPPVKKPRKSPRERTTQETPRTTFCREEYLPKKSTEKTFTRKKTYHSENRKKLVVGYFDALHGDKISSWLLTKRPTEIRTSIKSNMAWFALLYAFIFI